MFRISANIDHILEKIRTYQKYVSMNRRFIEELENEGGQIDELIKDVAELEAKILELQFRYRRFI